MSNASAKLILPCHRTTPAAGGGLEADGGMEDGCCTDDTAADGTESPPPTGVGASGVAISCSTATTTPSAVSTTPTTCHQVRAYHRCGEDSAAGAPAGQPACRPAGSSVGDAPSDPADRPATGIRCDAAGWTARDELCCAPDCTAGDPPCDPLGSSAGGPAAWGGSVTPPVSPIALPESARRAEAIKPCRSEAGGSQSASSSCGYQRSRLTATCVGQRVSSGPSIHHSGSANRRRPLHAATSDGPAHSSRVGVLVAGGAAIRRGRCGCSRGSPRRVVSVYHGWAAAGWHAWWGG